MLNLHNVEFLRSAVKREDFPTDMLPQIIFAGKSNVGKSSTINRLLNRKNFAHVGGKPGKTIHINFFLIDGQAYFADLPGYGYAKVSKEEKKRWGELLEIYFAEPEQMTQGFQIVDIRHKPTADDKVMADWFLGTGIPFTIIANKLDKIKKSELQSNLNLIRQTLMLPEEVDIIPFSAEKGDGKEAVLEKIMQCVAD